MALLNSMSTRGKITLAACALAFLLAALMIVKMAGAPSYTTVMTGVDPAKTSQISAALTAAGVPYELQNGGTAIAVQKGKETLANVALASKGLNSTSTQPGFEILDQQKLGASSQQQQIAYQRGLEGTIANTIGQIEGAQGAQVHLTLPQDNLFADESRGATAAVLIPADASMMEANAVRGIANLVASSVPGLKPSAVTITDGTGTMLWPSGDGTGAEAGGLPSKTAAEARYDAQLEASLNGLLTRTLGPGKAQVQVHSDLNLDKVDQEQLAYDQKGVALAQKKQTETLQGQGASAGGTAGSASNLPAYAQNGGASGSGNSNYKNTTTDSTFGVGKTVTKTTKAPGSVNRLDIGLMLDSSVKLNPAQMSALQKSLSSAAGLQKSRGDTFNVTSLPFAKPPAATTKSGPIPPAFAGILKGAGLGIGALLFLFFVTRHLKKREREELADAPSWLRQLEAAAPQPVMAMPQMIANANGQATEVMPAIATDDPRRQQLDTIIQHEPERVAAHLRQWITEDNK
ncbi:MAG TPA: flagellar basal-body MS-ring/collar protein FliF [Baekduia sp.]|nr:flagellar basal-body MS-ring/collar protein FliF [Baekduia sp.]